jgi:NDP-sugar pyrophosphorylase family protein
MKAMILAAGFGTRLRPLTNELPKALLPVANRPLIHYTLLLLKRYGITDIVINLHHQGKKIADALGDGAAMGVRVRYSWEPTILGTGGGIKQARQFLTGGTFLVINGDILVDLNLDKIVEGHHRRKAAVSMVVRADPEAAAYGAIELDGHDRIRRILGRGGQTAGPLRQFMFTGVHLLEPSVIDAIPGNGFSSITDVYIAMLLRDEKLFGHVMKGAWMDLGTPERYQDADRRLSNGQLKLSYLRPSGVGQEPTLQPLPQRKADRPRRQANTAAQGKASRVSRTGR